MQLRRDLDTTKLPFCSGLLMQRALLVAFCLAPVANAQYTRGYVFIAPTADTYSGATKSAYSAGGGAERTISNGIGVGFDLSGVVPGAGKAEKTVGVLSFNGYYHYNFHQSNWDLYGTGGYSNFFRDFAANGFNLGAGLNYWYTENHALSFEVREQAANKHPIFPEHHYIEVRIGWTFR